MHSYDKLKSPPLVQCAYCPSVEAAPVGLAVPVGSLYEASKAMLDACHDSNAPCPPLLLRFVNRFAVFENGA